LAIDSAGSACSVVVAVGDTLLCAERIEGNHGQAEALMPMVDAVMGRSGLLPGKLGLIAATVGPGSFTGIRVGLAAARGIALATGAQLVGVSSFEAVAAGLGWPECAESRSLLIAIESRREDIYVQLFDRTCIPVGHPAAVMPAALAQMVHTAVGAVPLLIAGDAAHRAACVLSDCMDVVARENSAPDAVGVWRAGLDRWCDGAVDPPRPLYLRPPDVTLSRESGTAALNRA
jgi:tRNA threonylcarbamoyladenosine biosynthesis protein TsaB